MINNNTILRKNKKNCVVGSLLFVVRRDSKAENIGLGAGVGIIYALFAAG
jgi:hypothetical protein